MTQIHPLVCFNILLKNQRIFKSYRWPCNKLWKYYGYKYNIKVGFWNTLGKNIEDCFIYYYHPKNSRKFVALN